MDRDMQQEMITKMMMMMMEAAEVMKREKNFCCEITEAC
jgi:hypothetical protein